MTIAVSAIATDEVHTDILPSVMNRRAFAEEFALPLQNTIYDSIHRNERGFSELGSHYLSFVSRIV